MAEMLIDACPTVCVVECMVTTASHRTSLSGWLHVVWNGEPRFMLVDDRGMATRLEIDDVLIRALGGARAVNQKRVTVIGERVSEASAVVRVVSIELEVDPK